MPNCLPQYVHLYSRPAPPAPPPVEDFSSVSDEEAAVADEAVAAAAVPGLRNRSPGSPAAMGRTGGLTSAGKKNYRVRTKNDRNGPCTNRCYAVQYRHCYVYIIGRRLNTNGLGKHINKNKNKKTLSRENSLGRGTVSMCAARDRYQQTLLPTRRSGR
jgi:hypothetical protein